MVDQRTQRLTGLLLLDRLALKRLTELRHAAAVVLRRGRAGLGHNIGQLAPAALACRDLLSCAFHRAGVRDFTDLLFAKRTLALPTSCSEEGIMPVQVRFCRSSREWWPK